MTPRSAFFLLGLATATACSAPAPAPPATTAPSDSGSMASGPVTPPATDPERITSAAAAAPDAVSREATIVSMDDKGMHTLREGTNGWTCFPDLPATPGADPMCLDKNGMLWADAWMNKKDPPQGKMGFGYMLMGGSDASNTDPFATTPAPDGKWVDTGPHVMVLNIGDSFAGYPTTADNTKAPYVMFAGTKYAHLMLPVAK
jgi:hypothetical protein